MDRKLKILLFSPYLPAVDTTACARKIFDNISLLHKKGHSIYLASFCSKQDKDRAKFIKPYCKRIHLEQIKNYLHYPRYTGLLRRKINSFYKEENIDIVQCEGAHLSRYLPQIKCPSVLVEHEVLSVSFAERAKKEKFGINKIILFMRSVKKRLEERDWYQKFNKIVVFSPDDKNIILRLYKLNNVVVIPLGLNLQDHPLGGAGEKTNDMIFVGNFSHYPNVDAAVYFSKRILPLIKNKLPGVSLVISGANPTGALKRLAELDRNITVNGYRQDLKDDYAKSKISIAPIRFGSGMRYKILESLAERVPVVSTSVGARGVSSRGGVTIADSDEDFACSIVDLLSSPNKLTAHGTEGRISVEKNYNWDILINKYENIYAELTR